MRVGMITTSLQPTRVENKKGIINSEQRCFNANKIILESEKTGRTYSEIFENMRRINKDLDKRKKELIQARKNLEKSLNAMRERRAPLFWETKGKSL